MTNELKLIRDRDITIALLKAKIDDLKAERAKDKELIADLQTHIIEQERELNDR